MSAATIILNKRLEEKRRGVEDWHKELTKAIDRMRLCQRTMMALEREVDEIKRALRIIEGKSA